MRAVFENFKSAEYRKNWVIGVSGDVLMLLTGLMIGYYVKFLFFM